MLLYFKNTNIYEEIITIYRKNYITKLGKRYN